MNNTLKYNKLTIYFFTKLMRFSRRFLKGYDEIIQREKLNIWKSRFENGSFEFTFFQNLRIELFEESALSKDIFEGFEYSELSFTHDILKKGDIYVDIGANIGMFSLVAADKVTETGKVIAFEPAPRTFERLKKNIQVNNLTQINAFNLGLSNVRQNLDFYVSETGHDAWNSLVKNEGYGVVKQIKIPVSTLDQELESVEKGRVKMIKIDVEGWEKFVLLGAESFLKEFSPIVMVEFTEANTFNAGYFVQEIYDLLEGWGYKWYRIDGGSLIPDPKRLHYPYNNLIAKKK